MAAPSVPIQANKWERNKKRSVDKMDEGRGKEMDYDVTKGFVTSKSWFDGSARGRDVPKGLTKANDSLRRIKGRDALVLLSSSGENDGTSPEPVILGTAEHPTCCQFLLQSQDPGMAFCIKDPAGENNGPTGVKHWSFHFRACRMELDNVFRVSRWGLDWEEIDSNKRRQTSQAGAASDALPAEEKPPREERLSQIEAMSKAWGINGTDGLTRDDNPEILDQILDCCVGPDPMKSLTFFKFGYKPDESPMGIPYLEVDQEDGKPQAVKDAEAQLQKFDQITFVLRYPDHDWTLLLVQYLDYLFELYDLGGRFWHDSCVQNVSGEWRAAVGKDEIRLDPKAAPGDMFAPFLDEKTRIFPAHHMWMRDPTDKDFPMNPHLQVNSFDDMRQFEHFTIHAMLAEMEDRQQAHDYHFSGQAEQSIKVLPTELAHVLLVEVTFDRTIEAPKLPPGVEVTMKCAETTEDKVPVWTAFVTEQFTSTANMVLTVEVSKQPGLVIGQLRRVTLEAANWEADWRHIRATRELCRNAPHDHRLMKLLLNQGYDPTLRAMRRRKNTARDAPDAWIAVDAIGKADGSDLALAQRKLRKAFYDDFPLNVQQREFVDTAIEDQSSLVFEHGPPGNGKSHTIAALVLETTYRGRRAMICTSSNAATIAAGKKVLKAQWYRTSDKSDRDMVVLTSMGTLKKDWHADKISRSKSAMRRMVNDLLGSIHAQGHTTDNRDFEYYRIGACMLRYAKESLEPGSENAAFAAATKQWLETGKALMDETHVGKTARTAFITTSELLIQLIVAKAKVVVSTCSNMACPIYKECIGYVDVVIQDEAAFSPLGDTYILLTINHGLFACVGNPQQLEPPVLSSSTSEWFGILKNSFFRMKQLVGWPLISVEPDI